MKSSGTRPSDTRRSKLKELDEKFINFPPLSNYTPIERYYEMANKLLKTFEYSWSRKELDDAYTYGRRYATFCAQVLPSHNYYNSENARFRGLRLSNIREVTRVIATLEEITKLMDEEELKKIREFHEKKRQEEQRMKLQTITKTTSTQDSQVPRDDFKLPAAPTGFASNTHRNTLIKSVQSIAPTPFSSTGQESKFELGESNHSNSNLQNLDDLTLLLPPLHLIPSDDVPSGLLQRQDEMMKHEPSWIPPPPPSYYQAIEALNTSSELPDSVKKKVGSTATPNDESTKSTAPWVSEELSSLQNPPSPTIPIATMTELFMEDFQSLLESRHIEISSLTTYQGRISTPGKDSTNGCTVISSLIVAHHLSSAGSGISDSEIDAIIDEISPDILNQVRSKLGLSGAALIIPSDANSFLLDLKILKQEQFIGVVGGNILNHNHIQQLLSPLINNNHSNHENGKEDTSSEEKKDASRLSRDRMLKEEMTKVAMTFFFHEHVISILKYVFADSSIRYDIIDSLPQDNKGGNLAATRIRCKDQESLEASLRWYACCKFTSLEREYIDEREWDDTMCDFDPRVFQAFVWKE